MTYHYEYLAWVFVSAIAASCTFAFVLIFMLLSRVLAEARRSDKEEYKLYVFLNDANIVLHEYYSQNASDKNGAK